MLCVSEHYLLSLLLPFLCLLSKNTNRQTCQQRCSRHPPRNKHAPCVCCSLSNLNSTAGISNRKSLQISSCGWAIIFNFEISLNSKLIPQNHDLLVKSEMGKKEDLSAYSLEYFCLWLIHNKTVPRILTPILIHSSLSLNQSLYMFSFHLFLGSLCSFRLGSPGLNIISSVQSLK